MGWIEAVLLLVAAGLIARTWRLLRPAPALAIGDRGIRDRRLGVGWIPWEQIEGVFRANRQGNDPETLVLRVRPTERLWRRLRGRGRAAASAPIPELIDLPVDLAGTDVSEVQIIQELLVHAPRGAIGGPHRSTAC